MGQGKGKARLDPGMLPSWGAHHRSMPHHSCGMTNVLPKLLAMAIAFRICNAYIQVCQDVKTVWNTTRTTATTDTFTLCGLLA